jgi:hypothetical protein
VPSSHSSGASGPQARDTEPLLQLCGAINLWLTIIVNAWARKGLIQIPLAFEFLDQVGEAPPGSPGVQVCTRYLLPVALGPVRPGTGASPDVVGAAG